MTKTPQPLWRDRRVVIGAGLVLAASISTAAVYSQREVLGITSPPDEPLIEEPLPERVSVVALGRLEPRGEVIRVSGPTGERIGRLEVIRGQWVETGEILAYLESHGEREAEQAFAASQLAEAEARLLAEQEFGQAQVQMATTRLDQIDRPAAFDIEAQEAVIRRLEAELALEVEDLERFQGLFEEGAIAEQTLDQQETAVARLQEELNTAQSQLIRLETARETDLINARAELGAARADLERAQILVALDSARSNLALAEARLERTLVRAPQSGRVLRILTRTGEAIPNDGGILDFGDTSQMFAVAEVYETDVNFVEVGQPAMIRSRNGAFEEELTGVVQEVGWQIFKNDVLDDDPAANADSRVVEVKIQLDEGEAVAALTNLQVDIRIDISADIAGAAEEDTAEMNGGDGPAVEESTDDNEQARHIETQRGDNVGGPV